ncbi:MAG: hypothetical protein U5K69_18245 [Balneolaceae bacterium]|nr:hypothetical protein [Balneolaceae bacterium]
MGGIIMNYFDHPYPRYGLAAVLAHNDIRINGKDSFPSQEELAKLAAEYINKAMHKYRLHTQDKPKDDAESTLQFRYLAFEDLATTKSEGQTSANYYYLAPHVATGDTSANRLITEARKKSKKLAKAKGLDKTVKLKRSFSPFTTKLNEGTKTLSNPKGTLLQAGFTLVTTITPIKPAIQVDFSNQVMIPDLPLEDLIEFIRLFDQMQSKETGNLDQEN